MHSNGSVISRVLGLVFLFVVPVFSQAVEIQASPGSITVNGVTPGGELAVTWAARTYGVVPQTSWDTFVVADDDRDGEVVLSNLDREALAGALWAVVDISSGAVRAFRLGNIGGVAVDISQRARSTGGTMGVSETISAPGGRVSLLLVRPGVGGWYTEVYDGAENDLDHAQDHLATTNADLLMPAGRAPDAPRSTKTNDIIIGLDSRAMIVTITTVS